jgi:hypothetical protein
MAKKGIIQDDKNCWRDPDDHKEIRENLRKQRNTKRIVKICELTCRVVQRIFITDKKEKTCYTGCKEEFLRVSHTVIVTRL